MTQVSYFGLSYGLAGCYMPDSHLGSYAVSTRRDMVQAVREALEFYDMPASCLHQVKWREVWRHAKRNGVSVLHFDITHGGNALHFGGMTQAEYQADNQDD